MLPAFSTILYATDLGRSAPTVLRHALSLARAYGGRVVCVHAVEPLGPSARHMVELYAGAETSPEAEERRWRELQRSLAGRLQTFCREEPCRDAEGRDLLAEVRVERGRPDQVILAEARRLGADAIVMGSHGHSSVGELFLGSTAHRVMQRATVPVLLVRVAEADTESAV
jgi:nucleotide-binding universal stress UspA family protein